MERRARSGRSRCSRRSRDRSRDARAARASCRGASPASVSSSRRSPSVGSVGGAACCRRHTALGRAVSTLRTGGTTTTPMLSCGPTCRPASRGGSAIGAASDADGLAARRRRRVLIAIPILLLTIFVLVGAAGMVAAAAAYNYYSQGLPDPKDTLSNLSFDQQTTIVDRTGKIELAKLGRVQARAGHVRRAPAGAPRRDDRHRGQGLLDEPRLRLRRLRLGDDRHPRGPAARRLDDHPAARPGPPPARRPRSTGSREERKMREIIQSLRLTQAYPGEEGKQEIITAYLNQNFYGNQSYGVKAAARTLLQQEPQGPHPRPGGGPRRDPPVADLVRPGPQRRGGLRDAEQEPGRLRGEQDQPRRPGHDRDLQAPQLRAGPDEVPQPADRLAPHAGRLRGREDRADHPGSAARQPLAGPAVRAARSARSSARSCARTCRRTSATRSTPAATRSRRRSTTKMQAIVEKWLYAAAWAPNHANTRTILKNLKIPSKDWGWI